MEKLWLPPDAAVPPDDFTADDFELSESDCLMLGAADKAFNERKTDYQTNDENDSYGSGIESKDEEEGND